MPHCPRPEGLLLGCRYQAARRVQRRRRLGLRARGTPPRVCSDRRICALLRGPAVAVEASGGRALKIYRLTLYPYAIHHERVADLDPDSFLPLSQAQFHVLVALTDGERHGYAIMQDVESLSRGRVRMGPATLYGTLKRLVDSGLAEELADRRGPNDDQRRRYYRLTALGQRVCAAEASRLDDLVRITRTNLRPGTA